MTLEGQSIPRLMVATVLDPAAVAKRIVGAQLPRNVLWTGLALVVVLSVLLVAAISFLAPVDPLAEAVAVPIGPLTYAVILAGSIVITVFALHWTGHMLGGSGPIDDTLALVVWLQFVLLAFQAVQGVLMLAVPLLGSIATLAAVVASLWVLVNFINVAQRFDNLGRAALTLVAALLGVAVGLSVLIGLVGASV